MILSKKYHTIMDQIRVTDDMKARILDNLQKSPPDKKDESRRYFTRNRKSLCIAACLAMILVGILTLPSLSAPPSKPTPPVTALHNSIKQLDSVSALSDAVGFDVMVFEQMPFTVDQMQYTSYQNKLAEISYIGKDSTAIFRQASGCDDISGDYTIYPVINEYTIGNIPVTLKGSSEDAYTLAIWNTEDFSYSLRLSSAVTAETFISIISQQLN